MVESFEKVPLEEMIISKITEVSLKKLFITINFLVICQVKYVAKILGNFRSYTASQHVEN